jgi:fructose-1,6-bisphosphatase I
MSKPLTLIQFIQAEQEKYPEASGEFSDLLSTIAQTAKIISKEINRAGLADILGKTGKTTHQGEEEKRLDTFADDAFTKALQESKDTCILASEEIVDPIPIPDDLPKGDYAVAFDPLDGSSNIDANVSVGTIFSIHQKISEGTTGSEKDLLQKGSNQKAAGYVIYGSSTMFVYSTGQGVHGFTFDPEEDDFFLSHPGIVIPKQVDVYSCNESYYHDWEKGMQNYSDWVKESNEADGRPYRARYIGSMVADVHRNLLYGGVFCYPGTKEKPQGKLRLLYEASPFAYIIAQAGGYASNGNENILEIEPNDLHQRVPLFIGNKEEVKRIEKFLSDK